jgi:endonuclease YncB( thermonuclease family)
MKQRLLTLLSAVLCLLALSACEIVIVTPDGQSANNSGGGDSSVYTVNSVPSGDTATVVDVIDGDTIDVRIGSSTYRVRYVGVNTPERDEDCYRQAVDANEALVSGQTVTLVRDTSDTDRFNRLLRYVYVGNTFVNATLIQQGYGEVVVYGSDDQFSATFRQLEITASNSGLGCHPSGIFDDGTYTR